MNVYKVLESGARVPVTQAGFADERNALVFARTCADAYARDWRAAVTLGRPRRFAGIVAVEVRESALAGVAAHRLPLHHLAFPELYAGEPAGHHAGTQAPPPPSPQHARAHAEHSVRAVPGTPSGLPPASTPSGLPPASTPVHAEPAGWRHVATLR